MPGNEIHLLTAMSMLAYGSAFALSMAARRAVTVRLASPTLMLAAGAVVLNATVVAVRLLEGHAPLASALEVFVLLALATGIVCVYLKAMDRRRHPELVLAPLAAGWLAAAVIVPAAVPKAFGQDVLNVVHVAVAIGGMGCFLAAAGAGVIYLRTHRALRRKDASALQSHWPSLERLDRFIRQLMPIGFALLTVAIALGLYEAFHLHGARFFRSWQTHPKMLIGGSAWVLYAVTLHVLHAKPFRGRQAAVLSVVGAVLLVAVLLVSLLMHEIPS